MESTIKPCLIIFSWSLTIGDRFRMWLQHMKTVQDGKSEQWTLKHVIRVIMWLLVQNKSDALLLSERIPEKGIF